MKIRIGLAALALAVLVSFGASETSYGFEPWSNFNGYWISADGKSVIKDAVEKGVTISKYQNLQKEIDWKQMAQSDISFVMVRLGYYDDQDPYFDENMKNADDAGLKTGVVFYGQAMTVEKAREEARYVLDIVKDYKVSYPIGYDVVSQSLLENKIGSEQLTKQVNAFCEEIEDAGYRVAVYGDYEWLTKRMDSRKIPYDVWYNRSGLANNFQNRTLWRCTDAGKVSGVTGNVCIEFCFEHYEDAFMDTGWREINGVRYYFVKHRMLKNTTMNIEGERYIFDSRGTARLVKSVGTR